MNTKFNIVYNCFYSKITDDMYMELDAAQTEALSEELLKNALSWFEFPRKNIFNYDDTNKSFNVSLDYEEINIIATYMIVEWLNQQLASIEVVRMKFSGSDFKFTSQANHMSKLIALKKEYERVGFHLQRLYKRRKVDSKGNIKSTFNSIMKTSVRGGHRNISAGSENSWEDMSENNSQSGGSEDSWDEMTNV